VAKKAQEPIVASELKRRSVERYIRIIEHPLKSGEAFQGFQPEVIWVENDKIVRRKLVDKPNLFEFAFTQAGELIDPRNGSADE
jgi:hypothetical protein